MKFFEKKYLPFITLFFVVLISRIPFLYAGYGVEEDSWGIALAAYQTNISGIYEPSRFPGHPVQEFVFSMLWGAGPIVFNGLCAFFSAIAVFYFALILKHFNFKYYFLASLAFAFVPVFYISSTYTIDFTWTLAFILIALYCLLKEMWGVCGIFLGLAVGCRITSGVMLLPFMMIVWQEGAFRKNFIVFARIAISMSIVALAAYLPLFVRFGTSFFMYYDQFPYPPITKVMYKMIIGVFGFVGVISLFIGVLTMFFSKSKNTRGELFLKGIDKKVLLAAATIIILFIVSYFRLPQKSGYMITIIPFVIILGGYYFSEKIFKMMCFALIISPFVCSINLTDKLRGSAHSEYAIKFTISGQEIFFDPFSGPIFSDYSKRKQKINYTNQVIEKINTINEKTVIIEGWWHNEIVVTMLPMKKNDLVVHRFYVNEEDLNFYIKEGYKIAYLPEQDIYNDLMYKMHLTKDVAEQFTH